MPVWAVLAAAGTGQRFGGQTPKQHVLLEGKSVLAHALDALAAHPRVVGVVVVTANTDAQPLPVCDVPVLRAYGGPTRAASVLEGLRAIPAVHRGLVLVHDAARPHLQMDDVEQLLAAADASPEGALLAAPVRDTLKRGGTQNHVAGTQSREGLWRALTPQCFNIELLKRALGVASAAQLEVTDESMAMEYIGRHPRLVVGREDNLKITTPADFAYLQFLMSRNA